MAQNNIHLAVKWPTETPESTAMKIGQALKASGFQVNDKVVGYRLLMFRKNETQWSQIYKRTRSSGFAYITCHGPEKCAATKEGHGRWHGDNLKETA
jgi:hypothetical protein